MYTLEYYTAIKKEVPFAATWMDLWIVILTEVSQTEKEKYWCDFPYMRHLKRNDTSELTKQRLTDLENKLKVAGGKGEDDPLYSTGNTAQLCDA